jgi:hypothetical protein
VDGVLTAETAVFVEFEFFRGVFLVLRRVVVALFAIVTAQCDFDAHSGLLLKISTAAVSVRRVLSLPERADLRHNK